MSSEAMEELSKKYNESSDEELASGMSDEGGEEDLHEEDVDNSSDSVDNYDDNPPGYISHDDWVASGKDPEMYKGKKAYEAEYDRIQEVKEMKHNQKEMSETLRFTVEAIEKREAATNKRHKAELEAVLEQAKEDGDTDTALDAASQLHNLESEPVVRQKPQVNPVISEFIGRNAALESEDVKAEFARIYNGKLKADGVGPDEQLSDAAIKGYMNDAMRRVKSLYPEKFESQRGNRQSVPRAKQKAVKPKGNVEDGLRKLNVEGLDGQNSDATVGIYNMIKRNNGQEAADRFAKNMGVDI